MGPFLLPEVPAAAGDLDGLGGVGEAQPACDGSDLEGAVLVAAVAAAAPQVQPVGMPRQGRFLSWARRLGWLSLAMRM